MNAVPPVRAMYETDLTERQQYGEEIWLWNQDPIDVVLNYYQLIRKINSSKNNLQESNLGIWISMISKLWLDMINMVSYSHFVLKYNHAKYVDVSTISDEF